VTQTPASATRPRSALHTLETVGVLALAVTVFLIPFPRITRLPQLPFIQISDLVLLVAVVCLGVGRLRTGLHHRAAYRFLLPLGLYVTAGALSLINTPHLMHGVTKLVGIASLLAAFFAVAEVGSEPVGLNKLVTAWLAATVVSTVLSCVGVVAFYVIGADTSLVRLVQFNYGSLPAAHYPRISGFYPNANMYCNYLIVSAGILVWQWQRVRKLATWLPWVLLVMIAISALFTVSTGAGGFAIAVGAWLWYQRKELPSLVRKLTPLVLAGCVIGALFMALVTILMIVPAGHGVHLFGPFNLIWEPSGRLAGWISVVDTIRHHPWLGSGVGEPVAHFVHRWASQGVLGGAAERTYHLEAHNIWLGLWGQMGILGITAFALFCLRMVRLTRPGRAGDLRPVAIPMFAVFAGAVLYHGLFGSIEDARHLWIFFGLAVAALSATSKPTTS